MTLWLVGGLDPTGGAGILRDFATACRVAQHRPCRVVVTAYTAQGHGAPASSRPLDPEGLRAQLEALPAPAAVKVGLCPDALAAVLVDALANVTAPIVVDPVFYATDGGDLGATAAGLIALLQRATIVTPNRSEAVVLAGEHDDEDALVSTVAEGLGAAAVLLKGGHARSPAVVTDRLWCEGRISRFTRPRLPGPDPRGTGCALATALACALAEGKGLVDAATEAIGWLDRVRTHTTDRGRDGHHLPATEPQ